MILLNKPIREIKKEDVLQFLEEQHPEAVQIDYKRDIPKGGVGKYFSAFGNTLGGIILFGVEEDRVTGLPKAWEGVENPSKIIEEISRSATDVDPRPQYDHPIQFEMENGKFLILLRIHEGAEAPYFTQGNGRILIRTGDITDPMDDASPETVKRLFDKRKAAEERRAIKEQIGESIFLDAVKFLENKRVRNNLEEPNSEYTGTPFDFQMHGVFGDDCTSMLTIKVQPFYPNKNSVSKERFVELVSSLSANTINFTCPERSFDSQPTYQGLLHYGLSRSDGAVFEQFHLDGYMEKRRNVMKCRGKGKYISSYDAIGTILGFLLCGTQLYESLGYQGSLKLRVSLTTNKTDGVMIREHGERFHTPVISKEMDWDYDSHTTILSDKPLLIDLLRCIAKDIYFGLGIGLLSEPKFTEILHEEGLI